MSRGARLRDQCLVLSGGKRGQFLQAGNPAPDCLIVVRHPPRRHTRHLQTVLDDPRSLGRFAVSPAVLEEIRRLEPRPQFAVLHTGREMAAGAHLVMLLCTDCHPLCILECRWQSDFASPGRDRVFPSRFLQTCGKTPMRRVRRDIEQPEYTKPTAPCNSTAPMIRTSFEAHSSPRLP